MKVLFLLGFVLLGCQTTSTLTFSGPNGRLHYETTCNGGGRSWSDCYTVASEVCRGKYKIVSQDGTQTYTTLNNNLMTFTHRALIYSCE